MAGESAGAASVYVHLVAPRYLFVYIYYFQFFPFIFLLFLVFNFILDLLVCSTRLSWRVATATCGLKARRTPTLT